MIKLDPIIAVKDVNASAEWYQSIFGCKRKHGGNEFAVMLSEQDEVLFCLHKWGEHEHPSMKSPNIKPGNGLILYYKTENLNLIRKNVESLDYPVEMDIQINPNSQKKEFSILDLDGYYLTITEYHNYDG